MGSRPNGLPAQWAPGPMGPESADLEESSSLAEITQAGLKLNKSWFDAKPGSMGSRPKFSKPEESSRSSSTSRAEQSQT